MIGGAAKQKGKDLPSGITSVALLAVMPWDHVAATPALSHVPLLAAGQAVIVLNPNNHLPGNPSVLAENVVHQVVVKMMITTEKQKHLRINQIEEK